MKLTLEKHGGLAAGIHRPPTMIDTGALSAPAAEELVQLLGAARLSQSPDGSGPGSVRDAMSYTISVDEGNRTTVITQSDGAMSSEFAALIGWIEKQQPVLRRLHDSD